MDHALGAVLGALVGDAAGAVLEFLDEDITPAMVEAALTMPGGGTWRIASGQITDDGELTMSLLRALAESPSEPRVAAAKRYATWVASRPFDIGGTTMASLGCLRHPHYGTRALSTPLCDLMAEAAQARCMDSKANGSMMRATPLGVWGASRSHDAIVRAVTDDVSLSHPNRSCVDATVMYVLAIASLVRDPGDVSKAIACARAYDACDEVRGWMDDALAGVIVPYEPQIGFVRIGFTHAFRHLAKGTPYVEALRETLSGGGDTDTNACIVGGLLGARFGASAIPEGMKAAVLGSDHSQGRHVRPGDLHPRDVPALVASLISMR